MGRYRRRARPASGRHLPRAGRRSVPVGGRVRRGGAQGEGRLHLRLGAGGSSHPAGLHHRRDHPASRGGQDPCAAGPSRAARRRGRRSPPRLGPLPRPAGRRRDRRDPRSRYAALGVGRGNRRVSPAATGHPTGTREQWLDARVRLLEAEKELTRLNDDLARRRRELPWVRVDQDYRFDTEDGEASLPDLFRGRSQLIVYHFMFAPTWEEGCPSCSSVADGFDGTHLHLENHDVAFTAVSRAPLEKLLAYRDRMGWSCPWASSGRCAFNFDYHVSFTEESVSKGGSYNFRPLEGWQVDPASLPYEGPGMSAFALED